MSAGTVKHFHDHLCEHHGFTLSYSWTRTVLQRAGLVSRAPRRGAHRRRRPRKPCVGMMLHQDGSRHAWLAGRGAARPDRHPGRRHLGDLLGASWSRRKAPRPPSGRSRRCSPSTACPARCIPTAAATTSTRPRPAARWTRGGRSQVGRALHQLGIEHIAAYSPEARGRSERAFGTLQDRLVKELALAGIATVEAANRFIAERYLPEHNRRFAVPPELEDSAFVPLVRPDQIDDFLCLHAERVVARDNTVRYGNRVLQLPAGPHRPHYVKAHVRPARVPRRHARRLPRTQMPRPLPRRWQTVRNPKPEGRVTRFDATRRRPVDKWTAAPRLTTSPQAQQPQQKRSIDVLAKPDKSTC